MIKGFLAKGRYKYPQKTDGKAIANSFEKANILNQYFKSVFITENCDTFPNKSNAKKHLGCKKGKASQKQQLSDYTCD